MKFKDFFLCFCIFSGIEFFICVDVGEGDREGLSLVMWKKSNKFGFKKLVVRGWFFG